MSSLSRNVGRTLLAAFIAVGCAQEPRTPPASRQYAPLLEEPAPSTGSQAVAAHAAFRGWLDAYKQTPADQQARLLEHGRALAAQRRAHLAGLMLSEPELALSMALSMAERRMLPADLATHVEQWRDGRGMLHVVGAIGDESSGAAARSVEKFVTFDGRDTVLRAGVYGRREALKTRDGLRLHGIELDGVFALTELPTRRLRPEDAVFFDYVPGSPCPTSRKASTAAEVVHDGDNAVGFCQPLHADELAQALTLDEDTALDDTAATAWTEGPKTVLFMRVDFDDRVGEPLSLSAAQTLINTSTNDFFVAGSFGKTSLTGVFPPVLRMPRTAGEYRDGGIYLQLLQDARQAARDAGYDLSAYNLDIVAHPNLFSGWAGRGYVGSKGTWLNGNFGMGVTAHELGHNYGVYHANYWNAGESIIGAGTLQEYGNPFDKMGNSGASHFNAWFKRLFDWTPASQVNTVTTSGTYRIYPLEVATPDGGMQSLKVPRNDSQSRDYWLEFRQGITSNASLMSGASVNFGFPFMGSTGSHLLDMTTGGNTSNSPLVIGRTFSDLATNRHFTPIGKGGTTPESLDIVVNFGPYPGNQAPTVTVAASQTMVPSNTAVTFTATATDPNGDALAYSWDFDDGTFSVNNAPTAVKTLTGNRVHQVRCTVSDMKGGTATAAVFVTVGTPTTFTLSGTVTMASLGLEGVRVTDGTRTTFSLSDGTWALTNVPAGSYTINAAKFDLTMTRGFAAPLTVSADTASLDFTAAPKPGYSISGRVTASGVGVAGVTISDGARTATTNGNGDFTVTGVPNGAYTLTATKTGWQFALSGTVRNPVEVMGGNATNATFIAQGQFVNGTLPASVATAPVVTDGYRTVTATRSNATSPWNYFMQGVPNGTWNLTATSPGVTLEPANFTNPITIAGMGRSNTNFQVQSTTTTYQVTGTARTGGTPLPGVVVSDGTRSSTTDSFGVYILTGVPAGTHTLTPTRAGYTFMPATRAVTVTTANLTGINFDTTVVNAPPTLAMGPSASMTPTTGTTVQLSVLGADDGGEANLTYTWSATGSWPTTFSANGTNGARSTTVTFTGAGTYTFEVTVTDAGGLTARGTVVVVVTQVSTSLEVSPTSASVLTGATQFFSAQGRDQFNRFMSLGAASWMVTGGGTIATNGMFTAGATPGGPFTVTASAGGRTGSASLTVVGSGAPVVTQAARATPSPVTGTTTALSVRATDDAGEPGLEYTWTATVAPGTVTFSQNASNAAKDTTVTFTQAGDYEFLVSILDGAGNLVTSVVRVTVQATPTSIELQPAIVTVTTMGTQQFTAVVADQFADPIAMQPAVTWAVSGGGAVNATGLFTAAATPGGPFALTASAGGVSANATITVNSMPDTEAPQVQLIDPVANARLSGMVTLIARAVDNVAVVKVEFFEGATKLGEDLSPPFQLVVDTGAWSDGVKALTAKAADAAGNSTTSDVVNVIIGMAGVDLLPPTVSIRAPTMGAMTGLTVMFAADASDDIGVTRVEFELDGAQVGVAAAAPYEGATTVTAGAHTLVAIASDASGKSTRSAAVGFTAIDPGGADGGEPMGDGGTTVTDAGTTTTADGGATTEADAGVTEPPQPGPGELVLGGCGCNGVGAAPWGLLGLLLVAVRARRRR
ncbi:MAG: PKD domain-containing protein [Myxococcus sp.]|nr:PKD domain-containing protein [Myxococcus sp.]